MEIYLQQHRQKCSSELQVEVEVEVEVIRRRLEIMKVNRTQKSQIERKNMTESMAGDNKIQNTK